MAACCQLNPARSSNIQRYMWIGCVDTKSLSYSLQPVYHPEEVRVKASFMLHLPTCRRSAHDDNSIFRRVFADFAHAVLISCLVDFVVAHVQRLDSEFLGAAIRWNIATVHRPWLSAYTDKGNMYTNGCELKCALTMKAWAHEAWTRHQSRSH